jgi:hypothetical protein
VAREELPLPEEVNEPEGAAEEWQPEQEPVDEDAPISDEELEAQALAADAAEEALVVVPVDEQKRLLKRPLLNKRNRLKKVSSRDSNAAC